MRKRFTSKALEDMHRSHTRRKTLLAIAMAAAASLDVMKLEAPHEDLVELFVGRGGNMFEWQADILHAIIAWSNDVSVIGSPVPLFMDDSFMPRLEARLRQAMSSLDGALSSMHARRLLDKCAQTRTEWLQKEVHGKLNGVQAHNQNAMISAIFDHMPDILKSLQNETGEGLNVESASSPQLEDEAIILPEEAAPPMAQPASGASDNDDFNFNEFLERQQKAMQAAMQAYDQDEQAQDDVNRPTESATPDPENGQEDRPAVSLPIHQPTPIAAPARNPAPSLAAISSINIPNAPPEPDSDTPTTIIRTKPPTLRASYDSARLAAHTRALQKKRPPSPANPSNRKVWSTEEENALLDGLDYVRGPHWRDILALYGENGIRGDALRGRSQVQLKDKARNMKLFYVKNGYDVPEILQNVTGELRGPKGRTEGVTDGVEERRGADEIEAAGAEVSVALSSSDGASGGGGEGMSGVENGTGEIGHTDEVILPSEPVLAEWAATVAT